MRRRIKLFYKALMSFVYRCVYWVIVNVPVFKHYQPVYGARISGDTQRECEDRWKVMAPFFQQRQGSVLDIGCNIGYFSFKAAEVGCFSYGVEVNDFTITCCNAIREANSVKTCLFMKDIVDPDFVRKMPAFDTVIHLSVFHHWVRAYGEQEACEMLKITASKCRAMIFETGQSNEIGTKWYKKLAFMGGDPKNWIGDFLREAGFAHVEIIGVFPSGLTDVQRYLFFAHKD